MADLETVELTRIRCSACGTVFAMTDHLQELRHKDYREFYCPNGHSLHYIDTEANAKKKERETYEHERDRAGQLASELEQARAEIKHLEDTRRWLKRNSKPR